VVEGSVLIGEAAAAGWRVEAEFVAPGADAVTNGEVHELAAGVIGRVATTEQAQPNIAIVAIPEQTVALASTSFVVVADRLADPGNLGTILRSCEAAGVDAVVITAGSVDPFNPKVVRASAGALFHVPVIGASYDDVRSAGLRMVGTSSHRGRTHTEADWSGRVAIVVGNEAHGLADEGPIDEWVMIEHHGRSESLNVAMAATIVVFEAARQRHR
jgi:TrmH family RNA methyltransferase